MTALLNGARVADIEERAEELNGILHNGGAIELDHVATLLGDLAALLRDHHELRLRITMARLGLDGRMHATMPNASAGTDT